MKNILAISGSLRKASTNTGLLRAAQKNAPNQVAITIADLSDIPFYNSDLEGNKPASVKRLCDQALAAEGFLFACPEYNYSIAPALKNAIDWLSREPDNAALAAKPAALLSAAAGMGGSRAQYQLRQVGVCTDLRFLNSPEVFVNAFEGDFNEQGDVIGEKTQQKVDELLQALLTALA